MKLRQKIIFLAIVPLILALCAIALAVRHQAISLGQQQRATIQAAYLASKEAELKHYVALATRSIAHLYESGRNDPTTLDEAKAILAKLSYGDDGYFFIYDMQSKSLITVSDQINANGGNHDPDRADGFAALQADIAKRECTEQGQRKPAHF